MMMLHHLTLSNAQRIRIKQMIRGHRALGELSRRMLRQQRAAFDALTPGVAGYQAAVDDLARAEGMATVERVERMAHLRLQVYATLTPAQQAQIDGLSARAQARRRARSGTRQPPPSGP